MRVQAIQVVAEVNPDVAKARELWEEIKKEAGLLPGGVITLQNLSPAIRKLAREYGKLGLSIPMSAYINGGSDTALVVVPLMMLETDSLVWRAISPGFQKITMEHRPDNDEIWDWETGQRLYINTKKTKRPWFNSIFTDPTGEAVEKGRATLKQHLLVVADYAEESGNKVAAKVLRWLAADPTRFSKIDKIIG